MERTVFIIVVLIFSLQGTICQRSHKWRPYESSADNDYTNFNRRRYEWRGNGLSLPDNYYTNLIKRYKIHMDERYELLLRPSFQNRFHKSLEYVPSIQGSN